METRPSWDEYFMQITKDVSARGSCLRRKVGCVLVNKHHRIMSTGYNGKASELPNCDTVIRVLGEAYPHACSAAFAPSGTNLDGCEAIHAEQNALLYCKKVRKIHTAYTTASPCITCVKLLLGTGCKRIVFAEQYPHTASMDLWLAAGREWIYLPFS